MLKPGAASGTPGRQMSFQGRADDAALTQIQDDPTAVEHGCIALRLWRNG